MHVTLFQRCPRNVHTGAAARLRSRRMPHVRRLLTHRALTHQEDPAEMQQQRCQHRTSGQGTPTTQEHEAAWVNKPSTVSTPSIKPPKGVLASAVSLLIR